MGIAANLLGRIFIGIEKEKEFVDLSFARFNELQDSEKRQKLLDNIRKTENVDMVLVNHAKTETLWLKKASVIFVLEIQKARCK